MLGPVWLILALVAALGTAGREILVKRARRAADEYVVVFWAAAGAAESRRPSAHARAILPPGATRCIL